jgi:hypothetical protein
MRMNVKLFTLQMPLIEAKEQCRNSVAKRNRECRIPEFIEDEPERQYLSSCKTAVKQVEP